MSHVQEMFKNEKWYFQQDGGHLHYYCDMKAYYDGNDVNRWLAQRETLKTLLPPYT